MTKGDGPYRIVQKVRENAYKIELLGGMNIVTFNVGGVTPYIKEEDEENEDFRVNPLEGGEVDPEQATIFNLFNHIKILV